jgi:DNA-binding MarR family transcriptional regulator
MSLSKDIHQKDFRSEYQKAIINIMYTHNHLVNNMSDVFKNFDLTRQQYNVLRILRGQFPGHATVNVIKDRMLDKMSDTSRILERLRLKNLVSRADSLNDKRAVEITITPAGMELLDKMEGPISKMDGLLNPLSQDEARHLNYLLDKIRSGSTEFMEEETEEAELVIQPEKF